MSSKGFASNCVKDQDFKPKNKPSQTPIHASSSFVFDSMQEGMDIFDHKKEGYVYGRYGNPQVQSVADKIARLELGDAYREDSAILTSSGMSAIHCLISTLLSPGDALLTQADLYGGTTDLLTDILEPNGMERITCDLNSEEQIVHTIREHPNIRMLYIESPANPLLSIISLDLISSLAEEHDLWSICDNTFATPYLQSPFQYDFDFVLHSTTKYLNGHGTALGGVVIGQDVESIARIRHQKTLMGCQASPFDSWTLNQGLKTLALRMEQHCQNAHKVASFLSNHSKVRKVYYPGLEEHRGFETARKQMRDFGGMLSFELDGSLDDAIRYSDQLEFIQRAPTLGDVESLILHPASMSHRNMPQEKRKSLGISDGLIRLSVGIEDVADIKEDLQSAFDKL